MSTVLRPVDHEDQLSLVEHLDELRTRLIISLFAFLVFFALCFWQSDRVLDIVNRPFHIATQSTQERGALAKTAPFQRSLGRFAPSTKAFAGAVAESKTADPATKRAAADLAERADAVAKGVPP